MARQRAPLSFGQGLDRTSGLGVVEPATFSDLRNVHVRDGRADVRRGLAARAALANEEAIILVHPIRSLGVGVLLAYRSDTRAVTLYQVAGDGTVAALVGVLWTIPAGASFPRAVACDSYGKLVIAHDEPNYTLRQVTRVYDPQAGTLADLTADLFAPTGSPTDRVAVKFRGVLRWLAYVVGWGYGTEADGDRAEIVRVSKPAEPTEFLPEHYFVAGQRGDAVLGCQPGGGLLGVLKGTELYEIFGTDHRTFGIRLADPHYGLAAQRLACVVGESVLFWSLDGPRAWGGGASVDLALPLDLQGPAADALAAAADPAYGFASYLPLHREALFCFGKWGYALDVRDPAAPKWSYRQFGVELACLGTVYPSPGAAPGALGPAVALVMDASPAVADRTVTVSWHYSGATPTGVIDLWRRDVTHAGAWAPLVQIAATGPTETRADTAPLNGTAYEYAGRVQVGGLYAAAFLSSNPSDWPATARISATTAAEVAPAPSTQLPQVTTLAILRSRNDVHLTWTAPVGMPPGVTYHVFDAVSSAAAGFESATTPLDATSADVETVDGMRYFSVVASKPGYLDSPKSNVVSEYGTSGGGHDPV